MLMPRSPNDVLSRLVVSCMILYCIQTRLKTKIESLQRNYHLTERPARNADGWNLWTSDLPNKSKFDFFFLLKPVHISLAFSFVLAHTVRYKSTYVFGGKP